MKLRFSALAFSICILSAQTPDLSGVWKANPEKSKVQGQPPANMVMIIEQKDSRIAGTVGTTGMHGEERSSFTFNTQRPGINSVRGVPMRTKAAWEGNTLMVDERVAGAHPAEIHDKYTLSPDGNTLTVDSTRSMNGREMASTLVFDKQPESAAAALHKPEQTAGEKYKNVTTVMKEMPASEFIDTMRYFTFSLGVDCQFCHAQDFASDEKRTKGTARMMIAMTHNINEANFKGRAEVRCFTCHQGHQQPVRVPE